MKTKCLALIVCFFVQLTTRAQTLPTKNEQYDFLSWYLKKKDLKEILDTTISFSIGGLTIKDIDQILRSNSKISKADRRYINRQIFKSNTSLALDTTVLPKINWKKKADNNTKSIGATESFISIPIFSKDRRMLFIAWGYSCGITCGKESIDVYTKSKSGVWKSSKIYAFPVVVF